MRIPHPFHYNEFSLAARAVRSAGNGRTALDFEQINLILAEVFHSVKNHFQLVLSLINLQEDFSAHLNRKEASLRLMTRVHAIALVQELEYRRLRDNDSKERDTPRLEVHSMMELIAEYNLGQFTALLPKQPAEIQVPELLIDSSKAVALALVCNEIFLNAVVHRPQSSEYQIRLSGYFQEDRFILHWEHRDVSCALDGDRLPNPGLGSLIIENYGNQLQAATTFWNQADNFFIDLSFPASMFHPITS